ncbi:MAG: C40 family peptidase [Gemmatimonadota bacterium]
MPPFRTASTRHPVARALVGCALVVTCGRGAGAQTTTHTRELPKPFAAMSLSALTMRDSLVAVARAQVGKKYVLGGQSPERGFDCSGLVRYVMAALEVSLPRTAKQQAAAGKAVARDTTHLRPGDLLTFGKSNLGASHVGIYVGGGRYVHASSRAGKVIESDINRSASPLIRAWQGVRRLVTTGDSAKIGDG